MNTLRNKFVSLALASTTILSFSGAILPVAQAQTSVADLQAQIAALLAQIQQLQSQLNTTSGGGASVSCSFTRDLTLGSKGNDVKCLQQWLNGQGYQVAASGAGSPGSETSNFGSLTKSALAKYQAAKGISPAAGYFGPITRASITSLGGGPAPVPGPSPVPAPASGLRVSLASDNPAAGSLIPSSGRAPVLAVNLTAGAASGMTVSELKFKKVGVLSDSSIAGAYIVENGQVLSQYNSIASGVISFSGLSLNIAAGQTRRLELAIDPAAGLTAGNTVGFSMNSAADVMAVDATNATVTPTGAFPLSGSTFTVTTVSNPSLATLAVASSSIGTEVTAGTNGNLVGAWSFTVTNSRVNLKTIKFTVTGSATKTDIRNVTLKVNGSQVGPMLPQVSAGGYAFFDASSAPGVLNTGSNNVQVFADVAGSPSFNFKFQILNAFDILATDSQYNVPVAGASNTGIEVSIKTGSITISQATDTPTGSIAKGQSSVTLAKFSLHAAGEAVKVKWLGVGLNIIGGTGSTVDHYFTNLALIDDAGGQVGTTINTLSTSVTCTDTAFAAGITGAGSGNYRNCFGNSASPINYTVPANTTRVLSLKADVANVSSTDFTTVTGITIANTNNLQGLTSSQTASTAAVNGAALTLAANSLTTAKSSALGDQSVAANASNLKIGSYALTASTAEGVTISNVSITVNGNTWSNAKLMIAGTQFGSTQGTISSGTTYSFSGTPFTVPAGQTKYLDVYADGLSGATGTKSPATVLSNCSGSGTLSLASVTCTSRNGQAVTFAGQATVTVALDSASPAARQITLGSSGQTLAIFRFTETSNVEDVKVTDLFVMQQVGSTSTAAGELRGVKTAFGNIKAYNSAGTLLADSGAPTAAISETDPIGAAGTAASSSFYYYKFSFASPVIVPRANSVSLTIKGDVSSYSSSGATDNTTHAFKIATLYKDTTLDHPSEVVVALGSTSNASSAITISPNVSSTNSNLIRLLRSKLTIAGGTAPDGVTSGRGKKANDDIGRITFTADAAGAVQIGSITITYSGSAPSTTKFFASSSVDLYDPVTGTAYDKVASTTTSLTYDLSNYQLTAGQSKTFYIRIDSTAGDNTNSGTTLPGVSGVAHNLTASINVSSDVTWKDALDSAAATGLPIESSTVPLALTTVTYSAGQ